MTSIYKIKFNRNSNYLNDDYQRLSDYEKERISNLDVESFFDYDGDDDKYNCLLISNYDEIKAYHEILESNLIKHTIVELSKKVLTNDIDIEWELKDKVHPTSQTKYNIFIDGINHWLYENLDIDTVLDRISKVGMNGLKDVERNFLKNYETKK